MSRSRSSAVWNERFLKFYDVFTRGFLVIFGLGIWRLTGLFVLAGQFKVSSNPHDGRLVTLRNRPVEFLITVAILFMLGGAIIAWGLFVSQRRRYERPSDTNHSTT